MPHCSITVLTRGHFGKQIRNKWRVLKCGVGEGRRRLVWPIVWKMKNCCHTESKTGTSYIQWKRRKLIGLVSSCIGTIFWYTLLKERWNRRDEKEVDTTRQWMILKKREELEVERESIRSHFLANRFGRGYGHVVGKITWWWWWWWFLRSISGTQINSIVR
jgi:hypothetical protein